MEVDGNSVEIGFGEQYNQMVKYATANRSATARPRRSSPVHQGQLDPPHLPGHDQARPRPEDPFSLPATCATATCSARSTSA
jgi:hypothetical protein